jgi:hypothetical protein
LVGLTVRGDVLILMMPESFGKFMNRKGSFRTAKIILPIIEPLVFLSAICCSASSEQPLCELGASAGMTYAFQDNMAGYSQLPSGYRDYNYTNRGELIGINGKILLNFLEWKYNIFCFEASYNQKGSRFDNHDSVWAGLGYKDSSWIAENRLDFLSMAIKTKPRIIYERLEFFLQFGISADLAVSKRSTYIENANDKFSSYDFSVPYGFGFALRMTNHIKAQFEIQRQPSLNKSYLVDYEVVKNDMFNVDIGITYAFFNKKSHR